MMRTAHVGRLAILAAFAVLVLAVPAAHAGPRVFIQIGAPVPVAPVIVAPRVIAPPPYAYGYGMVWRPAYYNWNGYGYALVPGAWVRPPYARALWVGPRWVRERRGAFWARGYWRR